MDVSVFIESPLFSYLILPLLIFCSRIIDVSIGTMRVIFVSKGYKLFAVVCGFFEVLVWVIAITQIIQNLTNPFCYIAYAGGFATGNYVGMYIEEKIALGSVLLRVITPNEIIELSGYLKKNKYGVTIIDAEGSVGTVKILFTIVPRIHLEKIVSHIKSVNPHAFYTIEDIRYVNEPNMTYNPGENPNWRSHLFGFPLRKGK